MAGYVIADVRATDEARFAGLAEILNRTSNTSIIVMDGV